jgi:hypothetical protein
MIMLRSLLLRFALVSTLCAATAGSLCAATVRILPYPDGVIGARVGRGVKAVPVLLYGSTLSGRFTQNVNEPFFLTKTVPSPDGKGTVEVILAQSDPLPEGVAAVLYMLAPAPAGSAVPYRFFPIIEDETALKKGSVRVLNFTTYPVAVRIVEGAIGNVAPRQQNVLQRSPDATDVRIEVAVQKPEGWVLAVGQNFGFGPNERSLLLITPGFVNEFGEANGLINTAIIRDVIREAPASPAAPTVAQLNRLGGN